MVSTWPFKKNFATSFKYINKTQLNRVELNMFEKIGKATQYGRNDNNILGYRNKKGYTEANITDIVLGKYEGTMLQY